MTQNVKKNYWRLLVCLLLVLVLAFTVVLTACNDPDDDTSTSSSTTTETEEELPIRNGDFEKFTETEGKATEYPITTVSNWTRSYDYLYDSGNKAKDESSKGKSGVINVNPDVFASSNSYHELAADKNPGTPEIKDDDGNIKDIGDKVLMIRNANPTALRFTSSNSYSLAANTYIKISVWVYTYDIKNRNGVAAEKGVNDDFGASITISGSSNSYDSISVRNINTYGTWQKYDFYIEGSSFQSTTIYVSLSLGKGTGSNQAEYASGYAFFDEVRMEKISKLDFASAAQDANTYQKRLQGNIVKFDYSDEAVALKATDPDANRPVAITFTDTLLTNTFADFSSENDDWKKDWDVGPTPGAEGSGVIAPADGDGLHEPTTVDAFKSKYPDMFTNYPFDNKNIFVLENKIPTSYTAITKDNGDYVINPGKSVIISVWVKTSAMLSGRGASVSLVTKGNSSVLDKEDWLYNSFTGIDTTTSATIKTDKDREDNPDYYWENWQEYSFVVQNNQATKITVGLRFTLGELDVTNIDPMHYTQGVAVFANLSVRDISLSQYSSASSSASQSKKVDLHTSEYYTATLKGFDSAYNNTTDINVEPAKPANFYGVSGGESAVGGSQPYFDGNTISGLVNNDDASWGNYQQKYPELAISADEWRDIASHGPALMIYNKDYASYGYISTSRTVAANAFLKISVRVKVIGDNAKAYFYLVNSDLSAEGDPYSLLRIDIAGSTVNGTDKDAFSAELYYEVSDTRGITKASGVNTDELGDGWVELSFFIATGEIAYNYRIECWNGARGATSKEEGYSEGYVFFNFLEEYSALDATSYQLVKDTYLSEYGYEADENGNYPDAIKMFQRIRNEDDTEDPEAIVAYFNTGYSTFTDLRESDRLEKEEEEDEEEEEDDDTKPDSTANMSWALLVSSLLLAVVLIFTIIFYTIRRATEGLRKKNKKVISGYSKNSRSRALNQKKKSDKKDDLIEYDNDSDDAEIEEDDDMEESETEEEITKTENPEEEIETDGSEEE